ncbi:unnamed protein product, partial [Didymodactylos carnosus]
MTDQTSSLSSSSQLVNPTIVRYGAIFLLLVGTFGNILSCIIFSTGTMRKSSTFRYLALLSLMDLVVLYSGLLDLFLTVEYGEFSLRKISPITCRLHTFVTYWSQHSSSWILSAISIDRAIATNWIQFARKFCTPKSAEYVVGVILLTTALFNSHELIFIRLDMNNVEFNEQTLLTSTTTIPQETMLSSFYYSDSTTHFQYTMSNYLSPQFIVPKMNSFKEKRAINEQQQQITVSKFISNIYKYFSNKLKNNTRTKRALPFGFTSPTREFNSYTNTLFYSPSSILPTTPIYNSTTVVFITSSTMSTRARKCAALKGSNYEYFWDHVWEWFDVCMYAVVPFSVMIIGTFFIVYRVYYQERRFFRSRRTYADSATRATPNKAKSLFYLLFTLNLLYFLLVSPVVFVTTILFRNPNEEVSHPTLTAIVYLMQYANHSLNFIFYGITSPPYRKTLFEWLEVISIYCPNRCQTCLKRQPKIKKQELKKNINPSNGNIGTPIHKHEKIQELSTAITALDDITALNRKNKIPITLQIDSTQINDTNSLLLNDYHAKKSNKLSK